MIFIIKILVFDYEQYLLKFVPQIQSNLYQIKRMFISKKTFCNYYFCSFRKLCFVNNHLYFFIMLLRLFYVKFSKLSTKENNPFDVKIKFNTIF